MDIKEMMDDVATSVEQSVPLSSPPASRDRVSYQQQAEVNSATSRKNLPGMPPYNAENITININDNTDQNMSNNSTKPTTSERHTSRLSRSKMDRYINQMDRNMGQVDTNVSQLDRNMNTTGQQRLDAFTTKPPLNTKPETTSHLKQIKVETSSSENISCPAYTGENPFLVQSVENQEHSTIGT